MFEKLKKTNYLKLVTHVKAPRWPNDPIGFMYDEYRKKNVMFKIINEEYIKIDGKEFKISAFNDCWICDNQRAYLYEDES